MMKLDAKKELSVDGARGKGGGEMESCRLALHIITIQQYCWMKLTGGTLSSPTTAKKRYKSLL